MADGFCVICMSGTVVLVCVSCCCVISYAVEVVDDVRLCRYFITEISFKFL